MYTKELINLYYHSIIQSFHLGGGAGVPYISSPAATLKLLSQVQRMETICFIEFLPVYNY
jgi:hypothetical protein